MKNTIQDKRKLVNSVFTTASKKYDLMNDLMSLGIHRIWKNRLLDWMNPQPGNNIIDVASGTGNIAELFIKRVGITANVVCVEPNEEMYHYGKLNLKKFKNIKWFKDSAEKLPFKKDTFDFYTISYGIRNVSDINRTIKEAFRVLKPGGRFMCLEFSKIDNELINLFYKNYAKVIPFVGKYVVGSSKPYEYLIESIDKFYNQEQLSELISRNGFSNVEYRNLSNGISAVHSGWKI